MSQSQRGLLTTDPCRPTGQLNDLAEQALSVVASRFSKKEYANVPNAPLVGRLLEAAMDRADETVQTAVDCMISTGIAPEVIVDDIVPRAARTMGEEWVKDISSFASVTLGSSRLQSLVRDFGTTWSADTAAQARSSVLLWVPQKAQHMLGATVVSTQLRRMGHSVHFVPGGRLEDLSDVLTNSSFDAVMVSASMAETAEDVSQIVKTSKSALSDVPVIVGGTILKNHRELEAATGAQLATNDLEKAAEFFSVAN